MAERLPVAGSLEDFSSTDSDDFHQDDPVPSSSHQTEADLSQLYMTEFPLEHFFGPAARYDPALIVDLNLSNNQLMQLPAQISRFVNVVSMDLSNNQFVSISEELSSLSKLRSLSARNNLLEDLPKSMQLLRRLEVLNVSGNAFESIPTVVFEITTLRALYFGANRIDQLPSRISQLTRLEILYLSGNHLNEVPAAIGRLRNLTSLALADNKLETIPPTFAELHMLQSLSLHNNRLRTLPTGIACLRNLEQLSLRNNPLVTKFVNDISFDPPSLKELAARVVKINTPVAVLREELPRDLLRYLNSANHCVNPRCKGVYFEDAQSTLNSSTSAESIVSRCCSISDYSSAESDDDSQPSVSTWSQAKMRKVLLG
ncbi:Protein Y42G9A.3 a [Aphelenchoides avenae]|nr:Protein Y42G9A.3 a [Aphelenchus avenae]